MINKQNILNILKFPYNCDNNDIELLTQLIEQYPYFQPPYYLILKHYKSDYLQYEKLLNKYILHIPNKKILHAIINNNFQDYSKNNAKEDDTTCNKDNNKQINLISPRTEKDTLTETLEQTLKEQTSNEAQKLEKSIIPQITFELDDKIEIIKPSDEDTSNNSFIKSKKILNKN